MGIDSLPPELRKLVEQEMARGDYASEDDVLLKAMQALADRRDAGEIANHTSFGAWAERNDLSADTDAAARQLRQRAGRRES